jgi:hypothetical protein
MGIYRLSRNVVYSVRDQQTVEVWGIDRPAPGLPSESAPRDTNNDDPLSANQDSCCCVLLLLLCGRWVTWDRIPEWLSVAEEAGYELVSGYKKLSPYSTIMIKDRQK